MISKADFKNLINEHNKHNELANKFDDLFPGSFDNPIIDWGFKMFDEVVRAYFDNEGYDWIVYYLYENPNHCYYKDEIEYPLETIDDLWKLIEEHRK